MKISIQKLHSVSGVRPPGYLNAVLSAGKVEGDWLIIEPSVYAALRERFCTAKPSGLRLGDKVAAIAQPVARAIDRAFGTHVADCRSCAERKAALNKI